MLIHRALKLLLQTGCQKRFSRAISFKNMLTIRSRDVPKTNYDRQFEHLILIGIDFHILFLLFLLNLVLIGNIHQTLNTLFDQFRHLQRSLTKILRYASYFQFCYPCLEMRSNIWSFVFYILRAFRIPGLLFNKL